MTRPVVAAPVNASTRHGKVWSLVSRSGCARRSSMRLSRRRVSSESPQAVLCAMSVNCASMLPLLLLHQSNHTTTACTTTLLLGNVTTIEYWVTIVVRSLPVFDNKMGDAQDEKLEDRKQRQLWSQIWSSKWIGKIESNKEENPVTITIDCCTMWLRVYVYSYRTRHKVVITRAESGSIFFGYRVRVVFHG